MAFQVGDPAPPPLPRRTEAEVMASWQNRVGPPVVTVSCSTYNHGAFIEDALRGFLGQITDFPFEIIVRDDGSTDGSAGIIRDYAARYPQIIRAVCEPHNTYREVSPTKAIRALSRGRYIAVCEGDDYWIRPDKLQRQHDLLQSKAVNHVFHSVYAVRDGVIVERHDLWRSYVAHAHRLRSGLTHAPTLSRMYVAADLELQAMPRVPGMDILSASMLACSADAYCIGDYFGGVYRLHDGGVWTSLGQSAAARRDVLRTRGQIARLLVQRGFALDAGIMALDILRSQLDIGRGPLSKKISVRLRNALWKINDIRANRRPL